MHLQSVASITEKKRSPNNSNVTDKKHHSFSTSIITPFNAKINQIANTITNNATITAPTISQSSKSRRIQQKPEKRKKKWIKFIFKTKTFDHIIFKRKALESVYFSSICILVLRSGLLYFYYSMQVGPENKVCVFGRRAESKVDTHQHQPHGVAKTAGMRTTIIEHRYLPSGSQRQLCRPCEDSGKSRVPGTR